jgi:hypothetical protein
MSFETLKILIEFAILLTIGLLTLDLLGDIKRVRDTLLWNRTEGQIIHTEIRTIFDKFGSFLLTYSTHIIYEYTVDAKTYKSNKISPIRELEVFLKKNNAQKYLDLFPVGKKIPVYYNSQKPEIAVLNHDNIKEVEEHIRFQIKIIFILLLFYIFLKILNLTDVW